MLFQLVLTKFFKSELFSCLPKVDHVIKSCKDLLLHQAIIACYSLHASETPFLINGSNTGREAGGKRGELKMVYVSTKGDLRDLYRQVRNNMHTTCNIAVLF